MKLNLRKIKRKLPFILITLNTSFLFIAVSCATKTTNSSTSNNPVSENMPPTIEDKVVSSKKPPKKDGKTPPNPGKNPKETPPPKKPPTTKPPKETPTPPITTPNPPEGVPPINPNPNPNQPNFDPSDPNFKFPSQSKTVPLSESNLKPTDSNYFKDTAYQRPNEEILYKEIFDRSFAIKVTKVSLFDEVTGIKHPEDSPPDYSSMDGTGWLFDYASNPEKTQFSLFIATNLHVAETASNSLGHGENIGKNKTKLFDYTDPRGDYVVALSLGKSPTEPKNFKPLDNLVHNSTLVNGQQIKQYTNKAFSTFNNGEEIKSILGPPKVVFAGFDYMSDDEYAQFDEVIESKIASYIETKSDIDTFRYNLIKDFKEKKNINPQLYKDLAILQIDVDFNKDNSENSKEFKNLVLKATSAFDASASRIRNNIVPNTNGEIPYISYDYAGIQKNPDIENNKSLKNYEYSHQYVNNVLIGGFPGNENSKQFWSRNNPTERYQDKNKTLGYVNISAQIEGGNGSITFFVGRPLYENHGFKYSNLFFSSLNFGASGSLGYSDYGVPIGIYSDVTQNKVNAYDVSKTGSIASFVQSSDIEISLGPKSAILHAYNIIDGSNKKLYPKQKTSFRENLDLLYPDGIGEFKFKNTAIFRNGYKLNN